LTELHSDIAHKDSSLELAAADAQVRELPAILYGAQRSRRLVVLGVPVVPVTGRLNAGDPEREKISRKSAHAPFCALLLP
jgi:hypothetical protein